MSSKVFTPLAYLKGVVPGGLAVVDDASGTVHAYVVDRGWPAEAPADPADGEPAKTRGGTLVKVGITGDAASEAQGGGWPSTAIPDAEAGGASQKPFFGPFIPPGAAPTHAYVCAHALRETAPDVRDAGDTATGAIYRIALSDGTLDGSTTDQLAGPFAIAFDAGGDLYATNARAGSGDAQIVRITADLATVTPVSLPGGVTLREAGAILWRDEGGDGVLYVTDLADDPSAARSDAGLAADKRGRVLRLVIDAGDPAVVASGTPYAGDVDRPIALQFGPAADDAPDAVYVLCAHPQARAEILHEDPDTPGQWCLPSWRAWEHPAGSIRRGDRPSPATDAATMADFAPALVGPGGLAIVAGADPQLFVATASGAPELPLGDGDAADPSAAVCAGIAWTWRKPRGAMVYRVGLS